MFFSYKNSHHYNNHCRYGDCCCNNCIKQAIADHAVGIIFHGEYIVLGHGFDFDIVETWSFVDVEGSAGVACTVLDNVTNVSVFFAVRVNKEAEHC